MTEGTTGTTGTIGTTETPPWYAGAGFDDLPEANRTELTGYLQARGWDKADARTTAFGAIKAHQEAQKLIGVPPEKIIRLPRGADDEQGWTDLRNKLGIPTDPKAYDFAGVKFSDGTELDDSFKATISKALVEANVPKERAPAVAQALVKYMEDAEGAEAGESEAALALERDTLQANWGNKFNANMIVAQNAARTLGVTPEQVAALEKVIGYAGVMEMFRNIGARTGEDSFVRSTAPNGGGGPMTKEEATATMAERKADSAWVARFMNGDAAAKREFDNLTRMMQ